MALVRDRDSLCLYRWTGLFLLCLRSCRRRVRVLARHP